MSSTTPYTGIPDGFRRELLAGNQLIGCWSSLVSPITAEVLGSPASIGFCSTANTRQTTSARSFRS